MKCKEVVLDWYCMCKKDGESINHFMLHYHVGRELWDMVFSLFGIHWVMPLQVVDLLASWLYKCSRHKSMVIWSTIPHRLMWGIWQKRNGHTFEGCERSTHDMKLFFLQTLLEWTNASGLFNFSSLTDLLDSCTFFALEFFFWFLSTQSMCFHSLY